MTFRLDGSAVGEAEAWGGDLHEGLDPLIDADHTEMVEFEGVDRPHDLEQPVAHRADEAEEVQPAGQHRRELGEAGAIVHKERDEGFVVERVDPAHGPHL